MPSVCQRHSSCWAPLLSPLSSHTHMPATDGCGAMAASAAEWHSAAPDARGHVKAVRFNATFQIVQIIQITYHPDHPDHPDHIIQMIQITSSRSSRSQIIQIIQIIQIKDKPCTIQIIQIIQIRSPRI